MEMINFWHLSDYCPAGCPRRFVIRLSARCLAGRSPPKTPNTFTSSAYMAGFNCQAHHKLWRLNNLVTSTLLSGMTKPIIFILQARCNPQM